MTPDQQKVWDATMNKGFGTGVPKFAYEKGGQVVDALANKGPLMLQPVAGPLRMRSFRRCHRFSHRHDWGQ
jgi:hypothetical protein